MNYQPVPFKVFNGHFIRNDVSIAKNGEYLFIENYDTFKKYFGTASYMYSSSKFVTPDLFEENCIFAMLKDYAATTNVNSVSCIDTTLIVNYSFEEFDTPTWKGHTPVIFSVPKSFIGYPHCTNFRFLRQEALIAINGVTASNTESNVELTLQGGWSGYHKVNKEERGIFKKGMDNILGVEYTPVFCKCQVVAGMNYAFICLSRGVYPDAKWSLVKVSLFKSLDGKVHRKAIEHLGPTEETPEVEKQINDAIKAFS
ncbi:hypothetical protein DQZ30_02470 [Salmonella enterica subsp. diarizonae]|nr:hypothetical protein [Salmonella enterica subsp. diarizonae]